MPVNFGTRTALKLGVTLAVWVSSISRLGAAVPPPNTNPKVAIRTDLGTIVLEIQADKAPGTARNFLKYVDAGLYDGTVFHRTVTLDNQPENAIKIEVIQGGEIPEGGTHFPAISLERTSLTGLKHEEGTISMGRDGVNTATESFFICIGPQPELDFGGKRNKDGQGFAAFGKVVAGMDTVSKIQKSPAEGQILKPPISIKYATRVTGPDQVVVQHLLIAFKDSIPEPKITRTKEEAKAKAEKLFKKIKMGGDFDSMVKANTDDEYPGTYSMANFGIARNKELKESSRGGMVRSFGEVSFSLPVGGVGMAVYDPKYSPFGWHIIKRIR